MDKDTFMGKLQACSSEFEWSYAGFHESMIRGSHPLYPHRLFCPITAVYLAATGKYECTIDAKTTARLGLNMPDDLSSQIISAADHIKAKGDVDYQFRIDILNAIGKDNHG